MSSGFPSDRFDDRRPPDSRDVELAAAMVRPPAILLVVIGVLGLLAAVWGLIELPELPAKMDEAIAQIDADPNFPADQKASWKEFLTMIKETAQEPFVAAWYVLGIVTSLLVIVGGVKLANLSGVGLPITASLLAMLPCTVGCCCALGLPVGIWALLVINRPAVRSVIAARRSAPPPNPDDPYMR